METSDVIAKNLQNSSTFHNDKLSGSE